MRGVLRSGVDPEDLMTPKPVGHHGPRTAGTAERRRPRHWKLKIWKRRTTLRRQRAEAMSRPEDAS